jgi:monoterpene epsilon-lactone hydrolase
MLSEQAKQIREMIKTEIAPKFTAGIPLEVQRQATENFSKLNPLPENVRVEPVTAGGVPAEWVCGEDAASDKVLLHLHGGGLVMGSCKSHRAAAAGWSLGTGARVLLPDYRLAPENPPPAAIEDAVAAYRWLVSSGIKPEDMMITADSAGGCLAMAALVWLRDAGDPLPAATALVSPMVDYAVTGESTTTRAEADFWLDKEQLMKVSEWYCCGMDPKSPMISPLYADLKGLPHTYIVAGVDEVLLSDATRLADRLGNAGVGVTLELCPGMWHVFPGFAAFVPEAMQSTERIGAFVRSKLFR